MQSHRADTSLPMHALLKLKKWFNSNKKINIKKAKEKQVAFDLLTLLNYYY